MFRQFIFNRMVQINLVICSTVVENQDIHQYTPLVFLSMAMKEQEFRKTKDHLDPNEETYPSNSFNSNDSAGNIKCIRWKWLRTEL